MVIISDALPIQFWPIAAQSYNEQTLGFVDKRCFFQEFACSDLIKLQLKDTDAANTYALKVVDSDGNLIDYLPFIKTAITGFNVFNLTFSQDDVAICDQFVKFYITQNNGTLDDETTDSETLDVWGEGDDLYKSDFIKFNSSIAYSPGWATKLISYKSSKNFAGINYPNDSNYFNLRVACRFFQQRGPTEQNALVLSNSKVINTSVSMRMQQLMTTILMPDYLHNKLQLIFAHASRGSVLIDGVEWTIEESYDRSLPDNKSPFQSANIWLTRKNYYVQNII